MGTSSAMVTGAEMELSDAGSCCFADNDAPNRGMKCCELVVVVMMRMMRKFPKMCLLMIVDRHHESEVEQVSMIYNENVHRLCVKM